METVTQSCPHCGAPIKIDPSKKFTLCEYCQSPIVIKHDAQNSEAKGTSIVLREIIPEFKTPATVDGLAGTLCLTKDEVYLMPNRTNFSTLFGKLEKHYIPLENIIGYKNGAMTRWSMYTNDGNSIEMITYKKELVIREIEARRSKFFENQGLPIPPLSMGNYFVSSSGQMISNGGGGCAITLIALIGSVASIIAGVTSLF